MEQCNCKGCQRGCGCNIPNKDLIEKYKKLNKTPLRVMHTADLHLPLIENIHEFYEVLFKIFEHGYEFDYSIIAGDIFNDKAKLSPEVIQLFSMFITQLSLQTKNQVVIVCGNHDKNEKNNNRLDSVSPIIENLKLANVILSVKSEIIDTEHLTFVNYSIFDSNYNFILSDSQIAKPVIGIYHGALNNSLTDIGYKFTGKKDINFDICDIVALGDIHKFQELKNEPIIVYSGNPKQLNFGESEDKGIVIWNILDKYHITYDRLLLDNPYIYKTIKLSEYESIKDSIKPTWKLRFINDINDNNAFDKAIKEIQSEGHNLKQAIKSSVDIKNDKLDLSNIKTLNNLNAIIKEKYKDKYNQYKEDLINLNTLYYNKVINSEVSSGTWSIKSLKWNNLFNFGENNELKLEDFKNNILLINGPNFSGKSSFISCITFAIFGSWTKSPAKYSDYVNSSKNNASSYIELEKNNKTYSIERKLVLTNKTFKNSVQFKCVTDDKLLNGDDVNETERLIEKHFGTLDNFKLTTLITQFDNLGFINEKSTKRKEILNQFLSLDFFKTMESLVDKDLNESKLKYNVHLETLKNNDYKSINIDELIEKNNNFQKKLQSNYWNTDDYKIIIDKYQKNIKNIGLSKEIDILTNQRIDLLNEFLTIKEKLYNLKQELDVKSELISKHTQLFNTSLKIKELTDKNKQLQSTINSVPCDFKFTDCQFLKNSLNNKRILKENEELISELQIQIKDFNGSEYGINVIEEKNLKNQISSLEKDLNKIKEQISKIETRINNIKIDSNDVLISEEKYNNAISKSSELTKEFNNEFNENQIIQFQINQYNKSKEKYEELEKLTNAYLYKYNLLLDYSNIIGKNGLPLDLINNYIKTISDIVTNIVSSVLDLEVKLEINDTKFNIYIKKSNDSQFRIIECGSGSEHFFVGLAIRLAFYKISNLVKSTLLIMDEPATSLDLEHQNKFGDFFETLNEYFDNVIVVTHLELLKSYTTQSLDIQKIDNFARLI